VDCSASEAGEFLCVRENLQQTLLQDVLYYQIGAMINAVFYVSKYALMKMNK
jgi:hypothetical protein